MGRFGQYRLAKQGFETQSQPRCRVRQQQGTDLIAKRQVGVHVSVFANQEPTAGNFGRDDSADLHHVGRMINLQALGTSLCHALVQHQHAQAHVVLSPTVPQGDLVIAVFTGLKGIVEPVGKGFALLFGPIIFCFILYRHHGIGRVMVKGTLSFANSWGKWFACRLVRRSR